MKKAVCVLLSFVLLLSINVNVFAQNTVSCHTADDAVLQFHEDGKFTIVHLTDSHFHYPIDSMLKQYMIEMLDTVQPDIVVLGGDIATDPADAEVFSPNPIADTIKDLTELFTQRGIYFTITLGNHDCEFGISADELFAYYALYGGKYFLGYDAQESLHGYGTHNLPVLSSDGSRVAYNLFMFDSGNTVYDENGNRLGYDSVHSDQIEWYVNTATVLKNQNNGKNVPSLVFQHIIVQEIVDKFFYEVKNSVGNLGEDFESLNYLYTPIPKLCSIKSGVFLEKPCPGYYNYGQLSAMKQVGDVVAVFSGHDHSNTFTVNIDGIDIVNTGGCKMQTVGRFFTSGVRVITIDENEPNEYQSYMLSVLDLSKQEGSKISEAGTVSDTDVFLNLLVERLIKTVMCFVRLFDFI